MADKIKDEQKSDAPKHQDKKADARKTDSKGVGISGAVRPGYGESRKIVRILSTDLPGDMPVKRGLRRIKGISFMFAHAICLSLNLNERKKVGEFSADELKQVEDFVKNHGQSESNNNNKLPNWMLNRRKDVETGKNIHLVMANLDFKKMEDINTMKRIRAYRGIRHELGLPVRGQRTRGSFRKNKTMGVSKKKAMSGKTAPSASKPAEKK